MGTFCELRASGYRLLVLAIVLSGIFLSFSSTAEAWWDIRSIDTMKYSRDKAREYMSDDLDEDLDKQMQVIAETGATHVAIATPYDEEFIPVLEKWVKAARKHGLKVWFRGNWAGWENWFEYPSITREDHITKTREFIFNNSRLFENGDIFTACPECENGGPGDPRQRGDKEEYRQFLIDEHQMMIDAFKKINKDVQVNVNSMNGDVARLIMNEETTKALGGVVAVDHYVETPKELAEDILEMSIESNGQVFLGEMGAPIPDIHGSMTQAEQAEWLDQALMRLAEVDSVAGINYWTARGGSTAIWSSNNEPKLAVAILRKYFDPETVQGKIVSSSGKAVEGVTVASQMKTVSSDKDGNFVLPYLEKEGNVIFSKPNYYDTVVSFAELNTGAEIVLEPKEVSLIDQLLQALATLFQKILPN